MPAKRRGRNPRPAGGSARGGGAGPQARHPRPPERPARSPTGVDDRTSQASVEGKDSRKRGSEPVADHAPGMVVMARIGAAHGVRGEVRLIAFAEDPARLPDYNPFATGCGRVLTLKTVRPVGSHLVARFAEIGDRDEAAALVNRTIAVPRDRLPPIEDEDEFYETDLVGLAVEAMDGRRLGTVGALFDFGAGPLLEVRFSGGGDALVPFTKAFVPVVDLAAGRIAIDPPPGLLGEPAGDGEEEAPGGPDPDGR